MQSTLDRVKADLAKPNIEKRINEIINRGDNTLYDMILLAEYFAVTHKRSYVVYWSTAGRARWEVENIEEYYARPITHTWVGEINWHTSLDEII